MNRCTMGFPMSVLLTLAMASCNGGLSEDSIATYPTPREVGTATLTAAATVPGYQHRLEVSRFRMGTTLATSTDSGFYKTVGTEGTFAVRISNGAVIAIPDADSPGNQVGPLSRDAKVHNARVLEYFVAAGVSKGQVKDVQVTTLMAGGGAVAEAHTSLMKAELVSFDSILNRAIEGIPVLDSVAWARFNADGDVVAEEVYWPAIPAAVVDEAKRLRRMLLDPSTSRIFFEGLPTKEGRVVIRHANMDDDRPFFARVSFDVQQRIAGGGAYTRHYDSSGIEFRLNTEGPIAVAPAVIR